MNKNLKKIPLFKSEIEESEFWVTHDSTDYIDWSKAKKNVSFTNLKRSTESVSIRFPSSLISDLKVIANKKDVPYQSYVKIILAEAVRKELNLR